MPALRLGAFIAVVVCALDAVARWPTLAAFSAREVREYLAALVGSVVLWSGVALLPRRLRLAAALALGPLLFVQGAALIALRRLPNDEGALFFANQWRFALDTAANSGDVRALALGLGLALGLALFLRMAPRAPASRWWGAASAVALLVTVSIAARARLSPAVPLTPDLNALRFGVTVASWGGSPPPFFAIVERYPAPVPARPPRFNVLWVVHETLGAQYLETPSGVSVMPRLLSMKGAPGVTWLERLHAVSSCTDVSVPSILSGVSSAADVERQAAALLPFDIAHAAGARTFVVSAQELGWAHMDRYLGRRAFDAFRSAEDLAPLDGPDEGVPDELAFREALRLMDDAHASGRRFVGLLRTNGTHGPYRVDEEDTPWKEDPGFGLGDRGGFVRYLNALHRLDREWGVFWRELEQRPWLDDTLVVVTADHGEAFQQHGLLWHCGTFFPEESAVPGVLRLPKAWRDEHPDEVAALEARAREVHFVTALGPTAAAVLGWPELVAQADQPPLWEAPRPRPVVFTNCSDFRACASVDFGLYDPRSGLRWVYDGSTQRWSAFREADDPRALHDVAAAHGGAPTEALGAARHEPAQRAVLRRLLER
jgi:hypothetical protein